MLSPRRTLQHRFIRVALALSFTTLAALLASSCLTPEATFEDGPTKSDDTRENIGGNGGETGVIDAGHCINRVKDGDETDTDCGGLDCEPCAIGDDCNKDRDCLDAVCARGECRDPSCTDGEKTGDETDVDCGGPMCGDCAPGDRCREDSDCDSRVCQSGQCAAPACNDRIHNGNESDIDCGGDCAPCEPGQACVIKKDCMQPPIDDAATTACSDQICTLICPAGFGDCNQDETDGCETNVNTDVSHCGACGDVCAPAHAAAGKCLGGDCLIDFESVGCAGSWLDCNGDPSDGCETNSNNDPNNCGGCNNLCSSTNGVPSCSAGACQIACEGSFANCDTKAGENGCEVDTATSTLHCGACGNACSAGGGQVSACDTSQDPACISIACDAPTDCGGQQPCGACGVDQLCNDRLDTTSNCGGCGITCGAQHANVACNDSGGWACGITSCIDSGGADYEDCDNNYDNGCETDVRTNLSQCGGCVPGAGTDCAALRNNASLHISSITCAGGSCDINGCSGSWADCDGNPNNGCEVNTATSGTRCGGCLSSDNNQGAGVDCSKAPNATGECSNSACVVNVCDLPKLTGTDCDPQSVTRVMDGGTSITGSFEATWDSINLYVIASVIDTTGFNDSPNHWQDDGVELYLDLGNNKSGSFDGNDVQLLFGWNDVTVQGNGTNLNLGAITVSQSSIGTGGYRLTITIPWSSMNGASAPAAGAVIGFDIAMNDDANGGERDGQIIWVGNNQNFNNPSLWGNLKLN